MNVSILRFPNFASKAFTLNYDDGLKCDEKLIELMSKYGFKGTFNVNSALCAKTPTKMSRSARLTLEEVGKLYKNSGNEVAVHGAHHVALVAVEKSMAFDEIISDRKALEGASGQVVRGMAYPYTGGYDEETKSIAKACGIHYSRTVNNTLGFELPRDWLELNPTCHHDEPTLLKLAQEFVELKEDNFIYSWFRWSPKWFLLWGHSTEFLINDNWDVIDKLGKIFSQSDDIWYATTGEVYDYLQAFYALEFSVDNRFVKNNSAIDVYICLQGNKYVLPAGKTTEIAELTKGKELL